MESVVTRAELQAVIERQMESWQRHDPVGAARYHSEDGIVESPMYSTRNGRKAIEEAYAAFFKSFPDASMKIQATLVDPPCIAVFATVNATHMDDFFGLPGTKRRIEFKHARLVTMNDEGQIVHERRIYDFTGVLVQLGVLRAKPAKP
jgi:uncharacterized protein (TIGR02246 family)